MRAITRLPLRAISFSFSGEISMLFLCLQLFQTGLHGGNIPAEHFRACILYMLKFCRSRAFSVRSSSNSSVSSASLTANSRLQMIRRKGSSFFPLISAVRSLVFSLICCTRLVQRSSSGLHIPLAKSTGRIFECQVRMQGSDAMGILRGRCGADHHKSVFPLAIQGILHYTDTC